ncbi:hypothetical protein JR316_0011393 [Psilocybe cubensis]|uniref:Uncharacterized protein n=2 Tax=Psilocybe cubensis TaxID=181762 RepID=A0ACB8GJF8_PSICU|nr:hypothetical protein JR316_0011393 [Psilocybe cubensis]KAH9475833.1 hypothetical protein JR316_0011393 [Psilocybe cubensis]
MRIPEVSTNVTVPTFDSANPMAYLPASVVRELTMASYVLVGALVVQLWDIANNIGTDYMLLRKHPLKPPAVVYCISRISTLAYLLAATLYETAPIGHCMMLSKLPPWIFVVALPSTSLLFYFRVCAMYHNNKAISAFFFVMWLGVVGGCVPSTIGVSGAMIGPTKYCISTTLKHYVALGTIMSLIYDSAVFIAISWRLTHLNLVDDMDINFKDVIKAIVLGKKLSKLSKVLLQDGQVYYLSTVVFNLAVLVIFYMESIPLVYRTLLGLPEFTLMNVMACRVYRKTKCGIYFENTTLDHLSIGGPITFGLPPVDVSQRPASISQNNMRRHVFSETASEGTTTTMPTSHTPTKMSTQDGESDLC